MKKTKNPEKAMTRDMYIDAVRAEEGEEKARKVELSFSSEVPYSRYWGVEILDHADGAVDLTRLNEIGCVLFNHKRDVVIGKSPASGSKRTGDVQRLSLIQTTKPKKSIRK